MAVEESGRSFSYQWERCDAAGALCKEIEGATLDEYVASAVDVGRALRLAVSIRNPQRTRTERSAPSALVEEAPPAEAAAPRVQGRRAAGSALTAVAESWFGTPPFELFYQWLQCDKTGAGCAAIFGATSKTYAATAADVEAGSLVVAVTARNGAGSATALSQPFTFAPEFTTMATCFENPINIDRPDTSPNVSIVAGGTVDITFPGFWDPPPPGCANWQFRYAWFLDSDGIGGTFLLDQGTSTAGYVTNGSQVGHRVNLQVTYEYTTNAYYASSKRSSPGVLVDPPPNSAPFFVTTNMGPVGGTTPPAGPVFAQYNDSDGDAGTVTVRVYNWDTGVTLSQKSFPNVSPNTAPNFFMDTGFTGHVGVEFTATDNRGAPASNNGVGFEMWATNVPSVPQLLAPLGTTTQPSLVTSPTPVLKTSAADPDGDPIGLNFRVSNVPDCANASGTQIVKESPLLATVTTSGGPVASWAVPEGLLKDGITYYWCGISDDVQITYGSPNSAWSAAKAFTVRVPSLGVRSSWPMWQRGPLAVNEATGNLVVALPGPSYPTAIGDLSVSLAYNSLDGRGNLFGLGNKWVVGTVGDVPAKLIDHSLFSQTPPANEYYDGIERVNADGSSDYYAHVGNANSGAYQSETSDRSQLFRNAEPTSRTWTLADPDGSVYTFHHTAELDKSYRLTSAEVAVGKSPDAKMVVTPDAQGRIDLIEAKIGATVLASLDFNWACTGALLCVTGPDGRAWKYIGETGATGRLRTVQLSWSGGSRDLARVGYTGSDLLNSYESANDIADTVPGWRTSHQVAITYNAQSKVQDVTDGPIRRDLAAAAGTDLTPKWSFTYTPGNVTTTATAALHAGTPLATARTAAGFTDVCPPRQQPTCTAKERAYYDGLWQTIETRNLFGAIAKSQFDPSGQLLWSEDELNKSTDVTFDQLTGLVTKSEGPDADGPGPLGRIATSYRYDETKIGTASTAGPALSGLQGAYYGTQTLQGRALTLQTDANIDASWIGSPAAGVPADGFSVRWRGLITIPTSGDYRFSTVATGATRLYVDGMQVIDQWTSQSGEVCSTEIEGLTAGKHFLLLEYKDTGAGTASVRLRRTAAGGACTNGGVEDGVVVASSELTANYGNRTSAVSPKNTDSGSDLVTFSHFKEPWLGLPDYTLVRDASGQDLVTSFEYDALGRVVSKVMPKGNQGRPLDAAGNLPAAPIDTLYQTTWAYYGNAATAPQDTQCGVASAQPQRGLLQSLSSPGVTAVTTVYDAGGRPLSVDSGTRVVCRVYTPDGRLDQEKAKKDSEGSLTSTVYTYDPDGNTLSVTEGGAPEAISSTYNEAGAVLESEDASAAVGAKVRPTYDLEGNVAQRVVQLPNGGASYTSSYVYDAENRVTSQTDPAGRSYGFIYDARGFLQAVNYPNNTFLWRSASDAGLVTDLHVRHGQVTTPGTEPADAQASPVVEYAYTYFQNGQRKSENRTGGANGSVIGTTGLTSFVYDPVGRLEQVTFPGAIGSRRYCYDRDSNRTGFTASAATACTTLAATYNYSSTAMDRLTSVVQGSTTSYTYDADGNVTGRGSDTFTWDRYGRHSGATTPGAGVSISGVQFTVDGVDNGVPVTGSSPFQRTLDTTTLSNGWHTIGAKVTTSTGKQAVAPTRVVKVQNGSPPPAFVQQIGPISSTTSSLSSSLSVPAAGVAAGNTLVVLGGSLTASIASVIDTKGNTYTLDRSFLPTPWSAINFDADQIDGLRITANRATVECVFFFCAVGDRFYTAQPPQADGVVYAKLTTLPTGAGSEVSVAGRIQNAESFSGNAYTAVFVEAGAADTYQLRKQVNGIWTTLASVAGPNMAAGDSLGLKLQGSTISVWRKPAAGSWAQIGTATDAAITGAGFTGVQLAPVSSTPGSVDDFTVAADFTLPGGGTPPVSDDFNRPDSTVLYTTARAVSVASGLITTPLVSGDTITVRFNYSTSRRVVTALEFSGILTSSRVDQVPGVKAGSGTALSTNVSGATAQASEFVVGAFAADNAAVFTPGAGFTGIASGSAGTSSIVGLHGEWKLVSAVGAYDATGTKASSTGWVSGLVTYRAISTSPDTTPPSVPGTPVVSVSAGTAQLSWSASSDAGGVAYYRVHRSAASGFTPGPANEIGQTTLLGYTDNGDGSGNGLAAGTYFYKLLAVDLAGNVSGASAQSAAATVAADTQLPTGAFTTPTPASGGTVSGTVTLAVSATPPAAAANTLSYGFDPVGFRNSRTLNGVTTRYLLTGLLETNAAGTVTLFDVDGPLGDLARYTAAPTTGQTAVSFAYHNAHGDLAAEADTAGVRTAAYTYDPFGAALEATPSNTTIERWTGQWDKKLDTTTALVEMGARPYDPTLGRFLAIDPIEGGSANGYDFALQDPVNQYDLDGSCVGPAAPVCVRVAVTVTTWGVRAALAVGGAGLAANLARGVFARIFTRPQMLEGASGSKIGPPLQKLARSIGWAVGPMGRGSQRGGTGGFRIYERGGNAAIRFHPGGRRFDAAHFGGAPYWSVTDSTGRRTRWRGVR